MLEQQTHSADPLLPPKALDGVKVLDLGHGIPLAQASKLMACFGAEVIKVEPSDGDPLRRSGPFPSDLPHSETSGLFQYLNVNKKGITLNLNSGHGRKLLMALLSWADILVEGLGAGVLDGLGFTYEEIEAANPALVAVSITPFGQSGPYRDYKSHEIQPYAFGGPMYFTGQPEREPVNSSNNVVDLHTGLAAAAAGMVAFRRAEASGVGDYIDIAASEVQLGNIDRRAAKLLAYSYTGVVGDRNLDHMGIGSGPFPCADGYINLLGGEFGFDRVCSMIEREDLMDDPRFNTPEGRRDPARGQAGPSQHRRDFGAGHILALLPIQVGRMGDGTAEASAIGSGEHHGRPSKGRAFLGTGHVGPNATPGDGGDDYAGKTVQDVPHSVAYPFSSAEPRAAQPGCLADCGMLGYSREELDKLRQWGVI